TELGDDEGAMAFLIQSLEARRAVTLQALQAGLQGGRYRRLIASLKGAIARPRFTGDVQEPCRRALPPLAAASWRPLRRAARDLRLSDPDAEFHAMRKRAKRTRYLAELISPVIGCRKDPSAERFIRLVTHVQDALGEHQDAVVAAREIERFLEEAGQN